MPKRHSDIDLMMYADQELPEEQAQELAEAISGDRAMSERVAGVREIGEAVRTHLELETDRAADEGRFGALWSAIEQDITTPPQESLRAVPVAEASDDGLLASLRAWWDSFHGHVLTGAAVAVATLALVLVIRPFERETERLVQAPRAAPVDGPEVLASQPPVVEKLEIYDGQGMVLTIAGDEGEAPTAVIWLESEDLAGEGPL